MNQKHLFFTVLLMVIIFASGCGSSAEQAATTTTPAWPTIAAPRATPARTATSAPTATPARTAAPAAAPISAEELARANQAFASGAVVYLYDPQPKTVSKSGLARTEFSLRYMLSKDSNAEANLILMSKVNAKGDESSMPMIYATIEDWTSKTGKITFRINPLLGTYEQSYKNAGIVVVDDPVYLDVYLGALGAPDGVGGGYTLSGSEMHLSNTVRIPVGQ